MKWHENRKFRFGRPLSMGLKEELSWEHLSIIAKEFWSFLPKNTNDLHNFMIYLFKIHLNSWSQMCQNWLRRCDDWDNSKLTELKANRNIRPFIAEWSSSAPKERKHCVCDSTNEYDTNHVGFFSKTGFEAKYTTDYQHVS